MGLAAQALGLIFARIARNDFWQVWADPLHGDGYQFWSGVGSGSPVFVGIYVYWRHHNCHVRHCPRLIWKTSGEHALCRKHHPSDPPKESDLNGE